MKTSLYLKGTLLNFYTQNVSLQPVSTLRTPSDKDHHSTLFGHLPSSLRSLEKGTGRVKFSHFLDVRLRTVQVPYDSLHLGLCR